MVLVTFRSGDGKKYKIELPPETTIEDAKKAFLEKISSSLGNKQVSSIKMINVQYHPLIWKIKILLLLS